MFFFWEMELKIKISKTEGRIGGYYCSIRFQFIQKEGSKTTVTVGITGRVYT